MKIDDYSFGRIVIAGKEYHGDVIVFHDHVRADWWRAEGHSLHREDLEEILAAKPHTLIIGCGAVGMLRIPAETKNLLDALNIHLIALRTSAACKEYNAHAEDAGVVGAFHLTC
jgi:hypothetical protein